MGVLHSGVWGGKGTARGVARRHSPMNWGRGRLQGVGLRGGAQPTHNTGWRPQRVARRICAGKGPAWGLRECRLHCASCAHVCSASLVLGHGEHREHATPWCTWYNPHQSDGMHTIHRLYTPCCCCGRVAAPMDLRFTAFGPAFAFTWWLKVVSNRLAFEADLL